MLNHISLLRDIGEIEPDFYLNLIVILVEIADSLVDTTTIGIHFL